MKKIVKEYLGYVLILIAVILIRAFIVTPVRVNGTSMNQTLYEGDILLLFKIAKIERNDIIVIDKTVEGSNIIKRVIALPGEKVKCENGIIYINDEKYDDVHAYGVTTDFEEVTLQGDEYFVLGDNRIISEDSRYFGPVSKEHINGEASFRLFPFKKIGSVLK